MGASYSSEEEGDDHLARVTKEQVDNVIHKPREEGDGMERPPEAGVISDNNLEDCDKTEKICDIEEAGAETKPDSDKSSAEVNKSISNMASPKKFIEVFYNYKALLVDCFRMWASQFLSGILASMLRGLRSALAPKHQGRARVGLRSALALEPFPWDH